MRVTLLSFHIHNATMQQDLYFTYVIFMYVCMYVAMFVYSSSP